MAALSANGLRICQWHRHGVLVNHIQVILEMKFCFGKKLQTTKEKCVFEGNYYMWSLILLNQCPQDRIVTFILRTTGLDKEEG